MQRKQRETAGAAKTEMAEMPKDFGLEEKTERNASERKRQTVFQDRTAKI